MKATKQGMFSCYGAVCCAMRIFAELMHLSILTVPTPHPPRSTNCLPPVWTMLKKALLKYNAQGGTEEMGTNA